MRVALATYGLHVGGMENFLFTLGELLRARGMHVTFVVTESIGAWHHRIDEIGFETIVVPPMLWRSRRAQAARLAAVLAQFDAVLLNHCEVGQTIVGRLPESCLAVSVLHNDAEPIYRVGLSDVPNVDRIVCVSSKILSEVLRRGVPADKTICIPYGVDVPTTWPKQNQLEMRRPRKTIFVGRLNHEQKGIFDIPPILAEARKQGAELSIEMVGDGDPELTILRQLFASTLPGFNVVFHGRKDHAETIQLLSQADILLMPSRFEGLPVTLLEAIAHGVVPIASFLPGITDDAISDGVNGILPPVGDIDGFARAIVRLQDAVEWQRMSHAAWKIARERFTKEIMVDRYIDLLNSPRRRRSSRIDSGDSVGRTLFGTSWSVPVGLVKLANVTKSAPR